MDGILKIVRKDDQRESEHGITDFHGNKGTGYGMGNRKHEEKYTV